MGQPDQFSENLPKLTLESIRKSIPDRLFFKDEHRFLISVFNALSLVLFTGYCASHYLRLSIFCLPFWIIYAVINGTLSTGVWVLGHECGHGAFSSKTWRNNSLGFFLHSCLLVPYFSWQHSHFIHHNKTNHLNEGESNAPTTIESRGGRLQMRIRDALGIDTWAIKEILLASIFGWPSYLLFGLKGGSSRGFTSHFIVPNHLFPLNKLLEVMASNLGIGLMIYLLYLWVQWTSFWEVMALYGGPYFAMNAWLTGYTWLQHTDENIPHYDQDSWDWLKGALCTIDRDYPEYINALHFEFGSTHVLHHLFSAIPHYNAREATREIIKVLGTRYNYDDENAWRSLWEIAKLGVVEKKDKGTWKYIKKYPFYKSNEENKVKK